MCNFRSYDLAVQLYQVCKKLRLSPVLRNQLERASSSIVLNLAEGQGRRTTADQRHFFTIAYGSAKECKAILELATYRDSKAYQLADISCAHIYRLISNVR